MPIIERNTETTYKKEEKYIPTKEEIKQILFKAKWNYNKAIYSALLLGFLSGMRIGEILALKKEDIDLNNNTISIYKTWSINEKGESYISEKTKTKSSTRKIYVPKIIIDEIYNRFNGEYLIYNTVNNLYSPRRFTVVLKHFFKECKYKNMTSHSCRHSFITLAQQNNLNFSFVSKYVGHATGVTTFDVYTHLNISKQNKELEDFVYSFFED